jgi:protein gp37
MQQTSIGWTDFSVNFLKYRNAKGETVWACVHASEGCRFCYSEALAKRWGRGESFTAENMKSLTPYFDMAEANQVLKSKKIAGKKVFVDDMTDLFGDWVSDEIIDQHFAVFCLRPDVTFQLLTKRAKRMRDYFSDPYHMNRTRTWVLVLDHMRALREAAASWPLPNVHLGVSVEDQENADERIPELLETPAAVRWISVEPLLAGINARTWHCACGWLGSESTLLPSPSSSLVCPQCGGSGGLLYRNWLDSEDGRRAAIDGIVIGGESGAGHREMPLTEALILAESARAAGVSVYVKQDSGPRPGMQGRIPNDVWAMKEWPTAA